MKTLLGKFCKDYRLPKASVHWRYGEMGIDTSNGLGEEAIATLKHEFGAAIAENTPEPAATSVQATVETGNHHIVLADPVLPTTYSLERLRTAEAISFADPLAIAAAAIAQAEMIQAEMRANIQAREQRLRATQQAANALADQCRKLELDTLNYELESKLTDNSLTAETQRLQK